MSLKKEYNKIKKLNPNGLGINLIRIAVMLFMGYLLNIVWNFVAPVWGLPVMTWLEFIGSLFLFNVILISISRYFKREEVAFSNKPEILNIEDFLKDMENNELP